MKHCVLNVHSREYRAEDGVYDVRCEGLRQGKASLVFTSEEQSFYEVAVLSHVIFRLARLHITMRLSPKVLANITKMLDFYSQFNPSPLSIKKFIDFGKPYGYLFCMHCSHRLIQASLMLLLNCRVNVFFRRGALPSLCIGNVNVKQSSINWSFISFKFPVSVHLIYSEFMDICQFQYPESTSSGCVSIT